MEDALVVPNAVFSLLPRTPCKPKLALINARPTKESTFDQAGMARVSARSFWPLFQKAMAPALDLERYIYSA